MLGDEHPPFGRSAVRDAGEGRQGLLADHALQRLRAIPTCVHRESQSNCHDETGTGHRYTQATRGKPQRVCSSCARGRTMNAARRCRTRCSSARGWTGRRRWPRGRRRASGLENAFSGRDAFQEGAPHWAAMQKTPPLTLTAIPDPSCALEDEPPKGRPAGLQLVQRAVGRRLAP